MAWSDGQETPDAPCESRVLPPGVDVVPSDESEEQKRIREAERVDLNMAVTSESLHKNRYRHSYLRESYVGGSHV